MNSLPFIIVSHQLPPAWLALLDGKCEYLVGPQAANNSNLSPELREALPRAEGLLTMLTVPVNEALLAEAPKLRIISQMAVGVDNIDLAACASRGIPVGHTPGVLTDATADMAMTLLLAAARGLTTATTDAREGRWGTWAPTQWLGMELRGATLGIAGMGAIGAATARRARAFGMNIVYFSRSEKPLLEAELGAQRVSFDTLLKLSDIVSLHTPLSAETENLINANTLNKMQPHAILVNTARGGVVDTDALYEALKNGSIAAAGLDVTAPEPLPPTHPLYNLPNCIIAPHIGSATAKTRRAMAWLACQNMLAGLAGDPLLHCANQQLFTRGLEQE